MLAPGCAGLEGALTAFYALDLVARLVEDVLVRGIVGTRGTSVGAVGETLGDAAGFSALKER
jgi:hypothetical protein